MRKCWGGSHHEALGINPHSRVQRRGMDYQTLFVPRSAQTWEPKEIIVVDDGSTDRTLAIARRFESAQLRVITQKNQGASAARNTGLLVEPAEITFSTWTRTISWHPTRLPNRWRHWDYLRSPRTLLSGSWGRFMYRYYRTQFMPSALWCDLSPVEWLIRKMQLNLYMQTASWLVSRELAEAAGPWDTRLLGDDDGEYFCRVLLACDRVQFVPEAKVYYRTSGPNSLSYIGHSDRKMVAQLCSMDLHIQYIRSLEDSQRVRDACITYLQNWVCFFYPDRADLDKASRGDGSEPGRKAAPPDALLEDRVDFGAFGAATSEARPGPSGAH